MKIWHLAYAATLALFALAFYFGRHATLSVRLLVVFGFFAFLGSGVYFFYLATLADRRDEEIERMW